MRRAPPRRLACPRLACPRLVQLKALFLPHLCGLSTAPAWQSASPFLLDGKGIGCPIGIWRKALADRPSLRRFCGLGLEDAVPSATTLSHFRIDLAEAGLAETVFDASNASMVGRRSIHPCNDCSQRYAAGGVI